MRGATRRQWSRQALSVFQSTLLMRGATCQRYIEVAPLDISIHAPHARSDLTPPPTNAGTAISIHAPHARSDLTRCHRKGSRHISIHAPHARSDQRCAHSRNLIFVFQSTLLMRGATDGDDSELRYLMISIHAPHARSDARWMITTRLAWAFQSTLLMRGATPRHRVLREPTQNFNPRSSCEERLQQTAHPRTETISIHAPHARSDREI